jgi:hypothetical protein
MLSALRDPTTRSSARWRNPLLRPFAVGWIVLRRLVALVRVVVHRWIRYHSGFVGRVLETLLWPLLFVYLAWASNPGNPFYIDQGFPWPWLGPWLIALRYGVGYGAVAGFGLLGMWAVMQPDAVYSRVCTFWAAPSPC